MNGNVSGDLRRLWEDFAAATRREESNRLFCLLRSAWAGGGGDLDADPIDNDAWRAWAEAMASWRREEATPAIEACRAAIDVFARRRDPVGVPQSRLLRAALHGLLARCQAERLLKMLDVPTVPGNDRGDAVAELEVTVHETRQVLRVGPWLAAGADYQFAKGTALFLRYDYHGAAHAFEEMLTEARANNDIPELVEAELWLGLSLDRLGRTRRAADCLTRATARSQPLREGPWPTVARHRRLLGRALAENARLERYLMVGDPEDRPLHGETALQCLEGARAIAEELGDDLLRWLVGDYHGDLLLGQDEVDAARAVFQRHQPDAARGYETRANGYHAYSLVKCCLNTSSPLPQALPAEERLDCVRRLGQARQDFEAVDDQPAIGMTDLLHALAEIGHSADDALDLLDRAIETLQRVGPARHLALAHFRRGHFLALNRRALSLGRQKGADPIPDLMEGLSLASDQGMADRTALFHQQFESLGADNLFLLLSSVMEARVSRQDADAAWEALCLDAGRLAHDYLTLANRALQEVAGSAGGSGSATGEAIAAVQELIEDYRNSMRDLVESGDEATTTVDIVELCRLAAERFNRLGMVPVEVAAPDDPMPGVVARPAMLRRVFLNLWTNSSDAMCRQQRSDNPLIQVSFSTRSDAGERGRRVVIRVEDNGPGLPEGVDVFGVRRETTRTGLVFCRDQIESLGGVIMPDPPADGGSGAVFVIELPGEPFRGD